jgi:DNA repair protein RecN (Recombination protein N)
MLHELIVHNLVIVERARIAPGAGLSVISGETGAGKSLLLDALDLVAGGRATAAQVGPHGDAVEVAAVFEVQAARAQRIQAACGVASADGTCILRRRVTSAGRSSAWINDVPVTVSALKAAAAFLVEIHAQDSARRLADPAEQVAALDAYGRHQALTDAYAAAHRQVLDLAAEAQRLAGAERGSQKELDFLRFQLGEITALDPRPGELAEVDARHRLLSAAEEWRGLCSEAATVLAEDERAVVRTVGRLARRLADAPMPELAEAGKALNDATAILADAAATCARAAERLDADPAELARLAERLDAYHALMRKHGDDEAALFAARDELTRRIAELDGLDERQARIAADLAAARERRAQAGAAVAEARRAAFAKLAAVVHRHLADLGMPKARIELSESTPAEPGPLGSVRQELFVRTNPGLPAGPLRDVASGGETARLLLALAAALAASDDTPLLVFDEVDAGVGGRLGAAIGGKLASLSQGRSVLAVTHTPQVAAAAGRHIVVRKVHGRSSTSVTVAELAGAEREAELAEMLGGGTAARAQAKALLEAAR